MPRRESVLSGLTLDAVVHLRSVWGTALCLSVSSQVFTLCRLPTLLEALRYGGSLNVEGSIRLIGLCSHKGCRHAAHEEVGRVRCRQQHACDRVGAARPGRCLRNSL